MAKKKPGGAITTDSYYYSQAQKEIDPSYNAKVTAMNNALKSQQQSLEQQKGGINSNFNTMVDSQNRNNNLNKNNLSNQMLGRGLGRSSIVTSGLAQQDQINGRMVGEIENQRQGALSDIDARKSLLAENNASAIATMEADKINEYYKLARQLQDRDLADWYNERQDNRADQSMKFDQSYKNQQLAWQKEAQRAEMAYKQQALAQQQAMQSAQLAWQKEQAGWDRDWKQQSLDAQKKEQEQQLLAGFTAKYFDNKNNATNINDMNNMNRELYTMANMYGMGDKLYDIAKQNPYTDPSAYSYKPTTSSSSSNSKKFSFDPLDFLMTGATGLRW